MGTAQRYQIMEKALIYEDFVHDTDLRIAFKHIRKSIQKNIGILEDELATYTVPSPDQWYRFNYR